ncbi:FAD-binding protein [Parahaliea mediterranea]|uniref:FAD-binding protein n=1 Tax=Parahaliea mediterranea TaxID=651086 RepID=A0A939DIH8_9GAMM|nr:FAD-binding protein [Parahaliea mediterranea]MBN7798904.1 FAD-binding protein [Parahaliea mediterranea]
MRSPLAHFPWMAALFSLWLVAAETQAQSCPALSTLASSCRNNDCDAELGENALNCPEDCADPGSQVMAYYTQGMACAPAPIYEPLSVAELQEDVRAVVSSGLKVKPAGTSHSATSIICGDGNSAVIRSTHLNAIGPVESFEAYSHTVNVEAGVEINDLQENLAAQGFSHGFGATGFGGISVGGAIATGAHGSSLQSSSTISSAVVALDVVGPDGALATYSEGTTGVSDPQLWSALKTNLGLLGYVARARLKLEPQFNIAMEVRYVDETSFVADGGVDAAVAGCDYVFLTWFPGQDEVQLLCGSRTANPVDSPYAQNQLFTPNLSGIETTFAVPGLQFAMCNQGQQCSIENTRLALYRDQPPLVITEGPEPLSPVASRHTVLTGPSHRMITLQPEKFLDNQPSFSQLEYEGAMPFSQIQDAVQYLNSIYNRDGICQPLIGTIMRFDNADDGLLISGNHARNGIVDGERMVHLEFVEYWGYGLDEAGLEAHVNTPYREIVTHLVENFDYWPHWGKNDEWVFQLPALQARNAPERNTFNQAIAQLDPYGVFSNTFTRDAGFVSPQEGGDFAQAYYGACAGLDSDGDGISDCADKHPNNFSGMYARIDDLGWGDGFFADGSCGNADDWNEMKGNFGAEQAQNMRAGWDYASENHTYTAATFNWNPAWGGNAGNWNRSWEVMFSAEFVAPATGRYCFGTDNGSPGTTIVTGRNSCSSVWINKSQVAEVGYNASPRRPAGCVDMVAGQSYRYDLYNRHHNANVSNSFVSHPSWCFGGDSDCEPVQALDQNDFIAKPDTGSF